MNVEGRSVEFKRELADDLEKDVVSFLNTLGLYDIHVEERDRKIVIRLFVSSGPDKPYYLLRYGRSSKGCFVRVGAAVPMPDCILDMMAAVFALT